MEKVVVFGSFVTDLTSRTPKLPEPGETILGTSFAMGAGGKGFNQAVACYKAGGEVTLVSKIGNDLLAEIGLSLMTELGMSQDYLIRTDEAATGTALISVRESDSQNSIVIVPGAGGTIKSSEIDNLAGLLADATYLMLQYEVNQDANAYIKDLASEKGLKIILNPAPFVEVADTFYKGLWLATPNEHEAEGITGIKIVDEASAQQVAEKLHSLGIENVVITLGEVGAYVSDGTKQELIPAFKVQAVDTTGAGDAFNGGLVAALAAGQDLFSAAKFANATASLAVQKEGTAQAMPTKEEVLAAYQLD